jgi:ribosomal protein S25|tara:strand:- start:457 stop:657 length:201 start_codon:yes stop_codon:yes gene_type:complete
VKSKKSKAVKSKKASKKPAKKRRKKSSDEDNSGIIVIDDDLEIDAEKELEERRAYLEEARSQDAAE